MLTTNAHLRYELLKARDELSKAYHKVESLTHALQENQNLMMDKAVQESHMHDKLLRLTAKNGELEGRVANLRNRVGELHRFVDEKNERINELELSLNAAVSLNEQLKTPAELNSM